MGESDTVTRYNKRTVTLAVLLAGLAGYVDALAFMGAKSYFVSFMSGNSTRLGTSLAAGDLASSAMLIGLILAFVVGVTLGSLVRHQLKKHQRASAIGVVAALLLLAALAHSFGLSGLSLLLCAVAMGSENAVFQGGDEAGIGLTYMTGALVKIGQGMAGQLSGQRNRHWVPYAILWSGLIVGAALGAKCHASWGMTALYFAALFAGGLVVYARLISAQPL
jgi:uncharacterized membrane protein YoaK (UPF0700 family)